MILEETNFLMLQKVESPPNAPASVNPRAQIVLNWFEEFRGKK